MQRRLSILFSICPLTAIRSASADLLPATYSALATGTLQEDKMPCLEQKVQVWQTACDESKLFEKSSEDVNVSCPNTDPDSDKPDVLIRVNPHKPFQTIVGFGGALTASSAHVIRKAPAVVQEGVLKKLFSSLAEGGANFQVIRLAIGASDFSLPEAVRRPSYDEHANDLSLQHFDISLHDKDVQPVLKRMLGLNPNISLIASPWTAPLWMKTDNSNGYGILRREHIEVYSRYLAKYVLFYQSENIIIQYLTLQNEAGHGHCGPEMPCMPMSAKNQHELGLQFASERAKYGLTTRILSYDHNWEMSSSEKLSAFGFWLLKTHLFPAWLMCGMCGLALGLHIAKKHERRSFLCPKFTITSSSVQTFVRRIKSAPALYSLLNHGVDSSPLNPTSQSRSSTSQSSSSNCCHCATEKAARVCNYQKAVHFVYFACIVSFLGWLTGLIATLFARRYGSFDSGMGSKFPEELLNLPGSDLVFDGIAWHCYGGQPDSMSRLHQLFPQQEHHVTECSGGSWTSNNSFSSDLLRDANKIIKSARNWAASYQKFNLILNEFGGPFCADPVCCQTCRPLLTIPSWASSMEDVKVEEDYYALVHHSAFLETGAQVVYSKASSSKVKVVAYQNPGGSLVIVAANMVLTSKRMKIRVLDVSTNRSFDVTSPAGLATFVW